MVFNVRSSKYSELWAIFNKGYLLLLQYNAHFTVEATNKRLIDF